MIWPLFLEIGAKMNKILILSHLIVLVWVIEQFCRHNDTLGNYFLVAFGTFLTLSSCMDSGISSTSFLNNVVKMALSCLIM